MRSQIEELLVHKGDYNFEVNNWGSCQYSGALAMYKAYFELREQHDPKALLKYLKYKFNYEISFKGIRKDEEAIDMYFKIEAKRWKWNFDINDIYENPEFEKIKDWQKRMIRNIRRAESADDLFFIGRASASDLWHTAPRVAESYFVGFKAKNLPTCEKPIGIERGPVGNVCAQSRNVLTGICCALLVDYNIVKNLNSFKGFDT